MGSSGLARLFAGRPFSDYRSFDRQQAEFLEALRKRFGVYNSVYYVWYNPPSTAFRDADAAS